MTSLYRIPAYSWVRKRDSVVMSHSLDAGRVWLHNCTKVQLFTCLQFV